IVGAHLENQGYNADKCTQIFDALQEGEVITEERLSERLVDFVYNEFEASTKEAFLDICCFFHRSKARHVVEYIVGAEEFKTLQDAALFTTELTTDYLWVGAEEMMERLVVHDVIRAKGRRMAGSTRIMDGESFVEAIEEKSLKDIKGISPYGTGSCVLEDGQLNSMRKSLRVLEWAGSFSGRSDKLFPKLRYVGLYGDTPHLPFLNLDAFGKLAVYEGPVFKEGFSIYKLPKSLRVLRSTLADDIEDSNSWEESRPIQIVENSSLQELHLADLWTITKLPEGFHCFVALKILNLARWFELEELPES
ncbi:hypothetical protein KI387_021600, partial [Taxus chinensis]